ncbi:TonB-dependent receptor plug domain-containing protein [Bacteroidia bacterium]|nr:TonB-dependent receptor plug domain-containing protein [Bacteroidia bacterium]MDA9213766.1 TonB-dependent receptor plug domain-containing protein [Bacteroidia bacterium]
MKKIILYYFLFLTTASSVFAQIMEADTKDGFGTVRGRIIDDKTGKSVYGAEIQLLNSSIESDVDGKFELKAAAGTHNLSIILANYADLNLTDIVVKLGEVTTIGDVRLSPVTESMTAVRISVKRMQNTESALLTSKRMAPNMIDGISAASFKRIGDGDAASAMKRVTGVSIEGGKYVYVRGLGDRYTKTTMNGVDIPGLDPDRNSIQMDLFPTAVIDNIVVAKTFTADMPADFTGGIVDLATKDFPSKKSFNVSFGLGYNPAMHLQSDYLDYEGSSTDFLGFDNGKRRNPTKGLNQIPSVVDAVSGNSLADEFYRINGDFDKNLGTTEKTSPVNFDFGISFANTKKLNRKYILGYQSSLSYKNQTDFFRDAQFNLYAKQNETSQTELIPFERQTGNYGVNNVILGYLGSIALKSKSDKFRFNILHIQNGESKAGKFFFRNSLQGANWDAQQYNLEFNQRSLTNAFLSGKHTRDRGNWEVEWKVAPTLSTMYDPDVRFTRIRVPDLTISSEAGFPQRIWRSLQEYNVANRLDITRKTRLSGFKTTLKFGAAYTFKYRDYSIESYQIQGGFDGFEDPQIIMLDQNLMSSTNRDGFYYTADFVDGRGFRNNPNAFKGSVNYAATYLSGDVDFTKDFKLIAGLRGEMYQQFYSGINQNGDELNNQEVMNHLRLFPTVNMVYRLKRKTNLRASFTQTTARPSFKELSFAQILDPITGRSFQGGLFSESVNIVDENGQSQNLLLWNGDLRPTNINNFDLRFETFMKRSDMLSVGVFYKSMTNPIEIVQYMADNNAYQPRNVGNATILGAEFELRKNLEVVHSALKYFSFNTNVTVTQSEISINDAEFLSRTFGARDGQTISRKRAMAGQAPYIVNGGLGYQSRTKLFEAGVYYNVQGPTLQFVGYANRADVFTVPFHSLNLTASGKFGYKNRMNLALKVSNLLNDKREQIFSSYQANSEFFQQLAPGTTVSVKFSYSM